MRDFGPLAFDNNRFLLVLLLFLYNHICNELSDLDVPMKDKSADDEAKALEKLPFLFAAVIAIVALFSENGIFSSILVWLAFTVGYLPAEKFLFFIDGIETNRRSGREVLHRLSESEIEQILSLVRSGSKIEAIKELRAINHDGLKEAHNAVELLSDFGLRWRDSVDKPIS